MTSNPTAEVLRDLDDIDHPRTVCALNLGGPVRFVGPRLVSVWSLGRIFTVNLQDGEQRTLLTYVHNDGPITSYDLTSDGRLLSYVRSSGDGVDLHLSTAAGDTTLGHVRTTQIGIGGSRTEFSPSGKYVAFGVSDHGRPAYLEVRTVDGTLVRTLTGTAALTWAGSPERLYYTNGDYVLGWDPIAGISIVTTGSWTFPVVSPDRRLVAYTAGDPSFVHILDVARNRVLAMPSRSDQAYFLTSTLLLYDRYEHCEPNCLNYGLGGGDSVRDKAIYDFSDGTEVHAAIEHIFTTWPAGSPSWF